MKAWLVERTKENPPLYALENVVIRLYLRMTLRQNNKPTYLLVHDQPESQALSDSDENTQHSSLINQLNVNSHYLCLISRNNTIVVKRS